jgi:hypothetical protein
MSILYAVGHYSLIADAPMLLDLEWADDAQQACDQVSQRRSMDGDYFAFEVNGTRITTKITTNEDRKVANLPEPI